MKKTSKFYNKEDESISDGRKKLMEFVKLVRKFSSNLKLTKLNSLHIYKKLRKILILAKQSFDKFLEMFIQQTEKHPEKISIKAE